MRVLITAGLFYPSKLGGPSRTLFWLSKGLVKNNIDVSVVTTNKYIEDENVHFDSWVKNNEINIRYCSSGSKLATKVVWHSIKEMKNADVVMLSAMFFIPCFFVGIYALITQKKVIWSPRGNIFESAINNNKGKLFYLKVIKAIFRKNVVFHATSTEEKVAIQKHFGEKCKVVIIPNYIDCPEKEIRNEKNSFPYFLYVGRIAPIKALDRLIESLTLSNQFINSNYKLLLAGYNNGEYFEMLLKKIDEYNLTKRVQFLGNISGKEKNLLYANAYFSILVSHSENFGNVVIESLAQGTPVITSLGTPWSTINESNSGYWIENNPWVIASYIDKAILLSIENYYEMRSNAFHLSKTYDVYNNIHNWIKLINE